MNPARIATLAAAAMLATPAFAAPIAKPAQFAICGVCHKVEKGAPNGIGPNLWGVGATKAGEVPGYAFSPAMKNSEDHLDQADARRLHLGAAEGGAGDEDDVRRPQGCRRRPRRSPIMCSR